MSRSLLLMLCLAVGLLILACGSPTNRNAAAPANTSVPTTAASPAATAETHTAANAVGVPECDNFINAYEDCVRTKVPEQARAQFQTALTTLRTNWKKLADDPQTKPGLVAACKTQLETTRTQMKMYNCTF